MILKAKHRLVLLGSFSLAATTAVLAFLPQEVLRREISRSSEKEITVSLDASFGKLTLLRGERGKVVVAEYSRPEDDKRELEMFYDISEGRGNLEINLTDDNKHKDRRSSSISWEEIKGERGDADERHLTTRFTDAVPLSFKIGIGAGRGDLDFTGLKVKNLKVSAGASSTELRCDEPNSVSCETVTIESGLSKFAASHLSNLNFRNLKFSGGVGSYTLDFNGKLRQKSYAEVEVGLGTITLYVPRNIPTRVITNDSWFSSVDVDDYFEKTKKNTYKTENFQQTDITLTIKVSSGLGSIKVRCR